MHKVESIDKVNVEGKRVIVRADLNLPISHGKISDITRITRIIPTLSYLIQNKAKIVLISHYGRPNGKFVLQMSLSPIVDQLSNILGKDIKFAMDIFSKDTKESINNLKPGELILLENLRFYPEEEANDEEFAKKLAGLGDIYVNEAFACSHREHASITTLPKFLPGYAGILLQEELDNLEQHLKNPKEKVMSIVGGSKISTKIDLLTALVQKSDYLVIGGAMANTFLKAKNYPIGTSTYDSEYIDVSLKLLANAEQYNCEIILPEDIVTAKSLENHTQCKVYQIEDTPDSEIIFDIGPSSVINVINKMQDSKTLIWNGPLGAFEHSHFSAGTTMVSREAAKLTTQGKLISVVGGGDTVAAISEFESQFTYASTGGGAFLEWLQGKELPAMVALQQSIDHKNSNKTQ
jgi:phosphoglycerate kinase